VGEGCTTFRKIRFTVDGGKGIVALARSPEHLFEICQVVLRLLAASVIHSVILSKRGFRDGDATSLAYLMEQCQSLKVLKLINLEMDESHCRVLGAYSRPDLDIKLEFCKLTSAGTIALVEVLGSNHGPTKLTYCDIDYSVISNGLRGNSRLKSLRLSSSNNCGVGSPLLAIASALKENESLVDLILRDGLWVNDETWGAICDSLETHPTLEVLYLCSDTPVTPPVLKSRIQALLEMMKVNLSIQSIRLDSLYSNHEIYRS
jgi:hypothetical protein